MINITEVYNIFPKKFHPYLKTIIILWEKKDIKNLKIEKMSWDLIPFNPSKKNKKFMDLYDTLIDQLIQNLENENI